jgi:hypothetical protein
VIQDKPPVIADTPMGGLDYGPAMDGAEADQPTSAQRAGDAEEAVPGLRGRPDPGRRVRVGRPS